MLIAHLDSSDTHHAQARSLLSPNGAEPLGANPITLAETLFAPARADRLEDAEAALRRLGVQELPFREGSAERLAEMRANVRLKMPDCCVLLTAQDHGGRVATFDSDLLHAAKALGLD